MENLKHKLVERVEELSVFRTGTFTLTSGKKSDFYFDGRSLSLDAEGSLLIGKIFLKKIMKEGIKFVGGPATAAIPIISSIVTLSSNLYKKNVSGFYIRDEINDHGLSKLIEGHLPKNSNVIIVDDTLTTGKSIIRAIREVEKLGCKVKNTFTVIDRDEGGAENIKQEGYTNYSILRYRKKTKSLDV